MFTKGAKFVHKICDFQSKPGENSKNRRTLPGRSRAVFSLKRMKIKSSCNDYDTQAKRRALSGLSQISVKSSDWPNSGYLRHRRLDLSAQIALPDPVVADSDVLHSIPVRQILQNHHTGDKGVNAFRLIAQNQIRRGFVASAKLFCQGIELLPGKSPAVLRQAEALPAQAQGRPGYP